MVFNFILKADGLVSCYAAEHVPMKMRDVTKNMMRLNDRNKIAVTASLHLWFVLKRGEWIRLTNVDDLKG